MSDAIFNSIRDELEARHAMAIAAVKPGLAALMNADKDEDGKLSIDEQVKAMQTGLFSPEVNQGVAALCQSKQHHQTLAFTAAQITVQIKRELDVLRTGIVGLNAKELAAASIEGMLKTMEPTASMPGVKLEPVSPKQSATLKTIYENQIRREDVVLLQEYQALRKSGNKATLPTEVAPMTSNALCSIGGRAI